MSPALLRTDDLGQATTVTLGLPWFQLSSPEVWGIPAPWELSLEYEVLFGPPACQSLGLWTGEGLHKDSVSTFAPLSRTPEHSKLFRSLKSLSGH